MAVYTNHHEMVALLLEYGASVAAAVQAHPALGGTVFALSDVRMMRLLVDAGLDPHIAADVIHIAIRKFGYLTLIETLKYHLECGRVLLWPTQFASKVPHPDVNFFHLSPRQSSNSPEKSSVSYSCETVGARGDCGAFLLYLSECAVPVRQSPPGGSR
ncbi:hypothetical protein BV898_07851 [Hypsibius exemplaris]|uniref:Uncharacterized protein n=1 Tax=Hypsibius exemplaris TaxID=2072580 RepID=A0A1W0WSB5_HYPEX|nr:hypothetical protein BV898_07851 [Hypsibius exemplaris]